MFGVRGHIQNYRGGTDVQAWTRTGTENRYHVLHWDSQCDLCQLVDSNNMNKDRYKR